MTESDTNKTTDNTQTLEKLEIELKKNIDFKKALDESSIVAITDRDGTITYVNDMFCNISKYSREELLGQNHRILKSGFHSPEFFENLWKTISNGKIWKGDIKNKAKDGSFYWVKTIIMPFSGNNEKPEYYIAIRTDISNQKRTEEKLRETLIELGEMDKKKNEFIGMIAHELKTPLQLIIGWSSVLKHPEMTGPLNEKQKKATDSIHFNAEKLSGIIGDLLVTQTMEYRKLGLSHNPFQVDKMMEEIAENFGEFAETNKIKFINTTTEHISLNSDKERIEQVLTNLIHNSLAFVPKNEGIIEIKAQKNEDNIIFSVKDNGLGIPNDKQAFLFKKFYQVDTSLTRKHGGTGLGLVVCKGIVTALGGNIWFETEPKEGTIFNFSIPINKILQRDWL